MNIDEINGEQYCKNCKYWGNANGRVCCTHTEAEKCWFANQLNGCDYFDGKLEPKQDWSKAWTVGYRPSIFSK